MKLAPLEYLTDGARHLICIPYSRDNLRRMAWELGIGKHWFHRDHYDIPKRRKEEIESKCRMVSTREIVKIIHESRPRKPKSRHNESKVWLPSIGENTTEGNDQ